MNQSRSVCSRIRNARASLDNAERSFRSNQEVRGELDLMLAEAELDNLRQKRQGISWTRHMLAACFAVLVLVAGCLGWWWASAYGGNTTNAAGLQGSPLIADQKELTAGADKQAPASYQNRASSAVPSGKDAVKAVLKDKPEVTGQAAVPKMQQAGSRDSGVRLSAGQMRQLIRSGKQELENIR